MANRDPSDISAAAAKPRPNWEDQRMDAEGVFVACLEGTELEGRETVWATPVGSSPLVPPPARAERITRPSPGKMNKRG